VERRFADAQEPSAWEKLPKLDPEKQVPVHIDKAVAAAGIEIADWRWLIKNEAIAAKITLKKDLPAGTGLRYSTYSKAGYTINGGSLVDLKALKVNEATVGSAEVRLAPDKTDRVFIYLTSEKHKAWVGHLQDRALEKEKPADGLIKSADEFAKLWTAWFGKEKLPEIDFDKQVVIVETSTKAGIHRLHLIDNTGDVQVFVSLVTGVPDKCSFGILAVDRKGIKTIQGKPISK
jgi:hypothetical protein